MRLQPAGGSPSLSSGSTRMSNSAISAARRASSSRSVLADAPGRFSTNSEAVM